MLEIKSFEYWLNLVKEGLIKTHNIIEYKQFLIDNLLNNGIKVEINILNKLVFNLIIDNPSDNDLDIVNHDIVDFYGYYPSVVKYRLKNDLIQLPW